MSFATAEATDSKFRGMPLLLRNAVSEAAYGRGPHRIYDNMDSDPLIDPLPAAGRPQSRLELLAAVFDHQSDATDVRAAAVKFCHLSQQQGPQIPGADAVTFGRVQSFRALVNAIAHSSASMTLAAAEALLRNIVTYVSSGPKLARQRAALNGKRLSRYQMWCYSAGNPADPFEEIGTTRSQAVNVLGLGFYVPREELVRWAHILPAGGEAFRPTAWDAGAEPGSEHWRPGGQTYRLDIDDFGVDEMVHAPTSGAQLSSAIESLL